jgi:hypothetical protein
MNIETRPDAVIRAGTPGGRIALMFAIQYRVPRAAFRLTA